MSTVHPLSVPLLLLTFLPALAASDEPDTGSICVEAYYDPAPTQAATPELFCDSRKLKLKIDDRATIPWPAKENLKVLGLELKAKHRIALYCGNKAQQAFKFRFSEYKSKKLCLFVNGLYKEVGMVDAATRGFPRGCKCKD